MLSIQRWYLDNRLRNYNYLIVNHSHKTAIAVDPLDASRYVDYIEAEGLDLEAIVLTHSHGDHHAGVPELLDYKNVRIYAGFTHSRFIVTHRLADCQILTLQTATIEVIATPGHIVDHYSFYVDGHLLCGDTIFNAGVGNVNDPSADVEVLYASVQRLKMLPSSTQIYPSHDYVLSNLEFALSIVPNDTDMLASRTKLQHYPSDTQPVMTLADELHHNIFMRCSEATTKSAIGLEPTDEDVLAFKRLRALKDVF